MSPCERIHLLLVDDEKEYLENSRPAFEDRYTVKTALGGKAALDFLKENKSAPFVILSDERMPDMTGRQLFQELKQRGIPCLGRILITAFGDAHMAVKTFNEGLIDNYIEKPLDRAKLALLFSYIDRCAGESDILIEQSQTLKDMKTAFAGVSKEATAGRLFEGVICFFREEINSLFQRQSALTHTLRRMKQAVEQGNQCNPADLKAGIQHLAEILERNEKTFEKINGFLRSTDTLSEFKRNYRGGYPLLNILQAAVSSVQTFALTGQIELSFNAQARGKFVTCIPADMFALFVNILLRGICVTPGGAKVQIETREEETQVVIRFKDAGPALEAPALEELFNRLPDGGQYDLTLAKSTVEKYGGQLRAESGPAGTMIQVIMPVAMEEQGN